MFYFISLKLWPRFANQPTLRSRNSTYLVRKSVVKYAITELVPLPGAIFIKELVTGVGRSGAIL